MAVNITWFGHSAFLIEGSERILIDPFLTDNPLAPLGPDGIDCDIICVTHGHRDHLGDAIPIAKRLNVPVVAVYELAQYMASRGVKQVEGMNFGGTLKRSKSAITMVSAVHSAGISESAFAHDGGFPAGFVVEMDGRTIYHAGDTSLFSDLKLIGEIYGPDIAMLPIGGRFTMDPRTARIAAGWLGSSIIIPMHYNTWPLIEQDAESFRADVEENVGAKVEILTPGVPLTV